MGFRFVLAVLLTIVVSVVATLAGDFTIPEDGHFLVDFSSGSPRVEMLSLHNPNETVAGPHVKPRATPRDLLPVDKTKCYADRRLNLKDYTRSLRLLQDRCAEPALIPTLSIWGYKVADAHVYVCNYNDNAECLPEELNGVMDYLDDHCRSIVDAGYVHAHHIKKTYGRDLSSHTICRNMFRRPPDV
ncbi:hypothetical protein F4818DRAFT_441681 [Hypoxylon cercidicola]|nr:hypothetical protein F4818DRAFT_441681 [Hypoxylon cercidicola]